MDAIVFDDSLKYVSNHPTPRRSRGESLIRLVMAGICNTDLEICRGYMGFKGVLGHEFTGIVEESDNPALVGKRVTGEINCPCGKCSLCRKGLGKHCRNRTVLGIQGRNGCMSRYFTLPDENLHIIDDGIPDEKAVFTEPLAAAFEITQSHHIGPHEKVLIVGGGKMGKLQAQVLKGTGCRLTVTDTHRENIEFFNELGIKAMAPENLDKEGHFDTVVECSGKPSGFELARQAVRPRGRIIQKSTYADKLQVNISMLVVDEIFLLGSRCGPFEPALRAISKGSVIVEPLIAGKYPLQKGVLAFEKAKTARGKVLLYVS